MQVRAFVLKLAHWSTLRAIKHNVECHQHMAVLRAVMEFPDAGWPDIPAEALTLTLTLGKACPV